MSEGRGEGEGRTEDYAAHDMRSDDSYAQRLHLLEEGDDRFFREEEAVEGEPELNPSVPKGRRGGEALEAAHHPAREQVVVHDERVPGVDPRRWAVAEDGSDAGCDRGGDGCICFKDVSWGHEDMGTDLLCSGE